MDIDAMSDMGREVAKELLRFHVSQEMFCPRCKSILDVKKAVSIDMTDRHGNTLSRALCVTCYDSGKERFAKDCEAKGIKVETLDGRKLYARA